MYGYVTLFLSSFFSTCFVNIYVVHLYNSIDTVTAWKKSCFILSEKSDFHVDNLLIAVHAFISKVKLATLVEGDQKAPFSIATTPRCRAGRYSFPWIVPLYP